MVVRACTVGCKLACLPPAHFELPCNGARPVTVPQCDLRPTSLLPAPSRPLPLAVFTMGRHAGRTSFHASHLSDTPTAGLSRPSTPPPPASPPSRQSPRQRQPIAASPPSASASLSAAAPPTSASPAPPSHTPTTPSHPPCSFTALLDVALDPDLDPHHLLRLVQRLDALNQEFKLVEVGGRVRVMHVHTGMLVCTKGCWCWCSSSLCSLASAGSCAKQCQLACVDATAPLCRQAQYADTPQVPFLVTHSRGIVPLAYPPGLPPQDPIPPSSPRSPTFQPSGCA